MQSASQPWDNIGLDKQIPKLSEIKIPEFFRQEFYFQISRVFPGLPGAREPWSLLKYCNETI